MASSDRELIKLYHIAKILKKTELSLEVQLQELYDYLFEEETSERTLFKLSIGRSWDSESVNRALSLAEEIITYYTSHYFEPSRLNVTYYKKQRKTAAYLDQLLSPIFIELLNRRGFSIPHDPFLREPIFILKKEIRTKTFPKSKKGEVKTNLIKDRFRSKLMNKGITSFFSPMV